MNLSRLLFVLALLAVAAPGAAFAQGNQPLPPGASTGEATNITASSATLNGAVNPNKEETTYFFEYGKTTAYGTKTPDVVVSGSNSGNSVEANITGLEPGTLYHFRLVARSAGGTDLGADKTFTTTGQPYALPTPTPGPNQKANAITIVAKPSIIVFGRSSVISGTLTGPKNTGVQVQLQSNPHPYTAGFKNTGAPVVTSATGTYAFTVKPAKHTRYLVVAKASPPVTSAIVQVLVRTRISFAVNDSTVRRGQRVRFSGKVAPAHTGRVVRIQRKIGTGAYRTVARATLRRSTNGSAYSKSIRVFRRATYRVRLSGHSDHATGTSRRRVIRIG